MNKSTLLKILSLLPHFLFRRVVQYFKLDNQKKNLSFEHSIETKKSILKSLFEGESELFLKYIQNSNYYGEYGSGLSTIYVSNFSTVKAISAETDILWINKIKDNLSSESNIELMHTNLGKILHFGRPESYVYKDKIKDYLNSIWVGDFKPDLVLIDGRFRVACFLTSLINAERGTHIIFDDYPSRPYYHIVEKFEKPISQNNRQAVFKVSKNYEENEIKYYLDKFEYVVD